MNCIFLTGRKFSKRTYTLTLSGSFNSSRGYVTVNGTKYTDEQTLEVESGTEIAVFVSGSSGTQRGYCAITHNGTVVHSGAEGTYTFVLTGNTEVAMTKNGSTFTYYYTAAITGS